MLFPTALVGSYPQPDWLIDRGRLAGRFPPRVRARELWRVDPAYLERGAAGCDLLAIRAQEQAGLDIVTDGEMCRESYSNRFATALDGVDIDNPGTALDRSGQPNPVPRVTGPVRRRHPVEADDARFLRANTGRTVKITVPGRSPWPSRRRTTTTAARKASPWRTPRRSTRRSGTCSRRAPTSSSWTSPTCRPGPRRRGVTGSGPSTGRWTDVAGTTAVHLCFGYAAIIHDRPSGYSFLPELAACSCDQVSVETAQSGLDCSVLAALDGKTVILGVLDLNDPAVETPETVMARVRRALPYVAADRLVLAPDCGMKYLPRDVAFGKLKAMTAAAARLRAELSSAGSAPNWVPDAGSD